MNFNVFAMAVRPFGGWLSPKILLAMKLTTLFLIITLMQVSARGYSQKINLNEDNKPLKEVFKVIEKQTSYVFFYDNNDIKSTKIAISIKNASIDEVLMECFKNLPLTYKIVEKNIVVTKKDEPVNSPINQKVPLKIQGKVTDTTGKPLPGVNIKVKGSNAGGISDVGGGFTITVPNDQAVLIFSFVGYITREIRIEDNTTLNVILKEDNKGLNEIVVVGYGTQKKVDLTGAVSTVSGAVLESRPIANVGRGLQGVLPGLNITSYSGQPGTRASFNIRGMTSVNGGGPLILVDGVETSLDDINPNDIASATILKDAASSAVYGGKAAFGVLLITTKSGRVGAPKVTYNMNYSIKRISNLPAIVTDIGTVMKYQTDAWQAQYGPGTYLWGLNATNYAYQRAANPSLPAVRVDPDNPSLYDYAGETNYFKELYKGNNPSQIHAITVSGGTEKVQYFFSAGYNSQTGLFNYNPDYYKRYNLRGKLDIQLTDWLHIYTNSAYNKSDYNSPAFWTSDWGSTPQGEFASDYSVRPVKNPDGTFSEAGADVAFLMDKQARADTTTNRIQNTIGFNTSFFKNTWRIIGDYTYRSTNDYVQATYVGQPYTTGPNQTPSYAGHSAAYAGADDDAFYNINLRTEYEKNFGKKNYFKAMVGYNQEMDSYRAFNAENSNLISNSIGTLNQTTGAIPTVGANGYQSSRRGFFGRINYEYDKRYLLEVSAREDGSSLFPPNQQYGFFPSASAGWRISEEPFFKGLKSVVNNLKLRASYGSLGSDQSLGNYAFYPILGSGTTGNILGGIQPTYLSAANLVASSLTWESIYTKNIGLDVTLFNKLNVTFDAYRRDTKNMITAGFQLPAVLGVSLPPANNANLKTYGWELNLTYNDQFELAGKPFRFGVHANVWDNQTTITKYNNPTDYILSGNGYYTGSHVGDIWGLTTLGIFQTNAAAKAAPDQSLFKGNYPLNVAGELQYKDLNHDGKITYGDGTAKNPGDFSVIGNTTPRYSFGAGGNFTYSNFDFSIFFQGVMKESFFPGASSYFWSVQYAPYSNVYQNVINNTWTPQNPNAFFPSLKGARANNGALYDLGVPQTRYIYSAAYIRLKNLSVGYSFPVPILKKIGVDRIRVYLSGEDLWESDKLPQGYDPEGLRGQTGSGMIYPFERTYSFGLDVKF